MHICHGCQTTTAEI